MELVDCITVQRNPSRVLDTLRFFLQDSAHYRLWHPDHLNCLWIKGSPFKVGSLLQVEETLHGRRHRLVFKLHRVEEGRRVHFHMLFPASLICRGGEFAAEPVGQATRFTARLAFRFGSLLLRLFPQRIKAIRQHMRQEGEYLKAFAENEGQV